MTTEENEIIDDGTEDHVHGLIDNFTDIKKIDMRNVDIDQFTKTKFKDL